MKHSYDKDFFEYLIKNVIQHYNLIDDNLIKSEKPDFKNNITGLEITRCDPSLNFDGFINKYPKEKIVNINKFNKNFKELGGTVLKKTDAIVNILNLNGTFHYSEDYIYISPGYEDSTDLIHKKIKKKLEKLNKEYDKTLQNYYLGIFSPVYIHESTLSQELIIIKTIQSIFEKKFNKIIIVCVDKICVFDLDNSNYSIINNKDFINSISMETKKELDELYNNYYN